MKKTRKIISLLLSLLMIITSVPLMTVNSFAADVVNSGTTGDCTWTLDSDGVLTISGNGKMKDCSGGDALPWGTSITNVIIEDGVTSICELAFFNCTSLTSVTIPDSVTNIGDQAFWGCTSLTSVTIPDSVTSIGDYVFYDCTSLASITIPDSVSEIGRVAFKGTAYYNDISNWDNGLLYIGNHLIEAKEDVSGSIEIRQGTKTIAADAFSGCASITSVTIPDSVTSIGESAFEECTSLTSVTIPDSVTSIGDYVFCDCTSLTSITIPNSVTNIGYLAFYNCSLLTSVTIPDSVTSIGESAFEECTSLTSVTIPDGVTNIGYSAFENTAYYNNESNWDNGILYIGNHLIKAKDDVSGSVEIKQGTKAIAEMSFCDCSSLTGVKIPEGVTGIVYETFRGCASLANVEIPESVTSIGAFAFSGCLSLESVKLSDRITEIELGAFGYYYDYEEWDFVAIDDFKIYGIVGSEAERYADDNSIEFISIDGTPVKSFPDVTRGDWYYSAVKYNSRNGYVTGYSNGTFGPANNIQRQDFVLILARIAGADLSAYEGQNGGFSDVQTGSYYASAVAWAKDTGVVNGFSADNFGVGTYISREQICIMLCRYLNGSASGDVDAILNAYSDGGNTSPWAKDSVAWAVENGIIGNSDYLNPTGNAGRAEVAQIIYNMSNNGIL